MSTTEVRPGRRFAVRLSMLALLFVACAGDGSDIGPRLSRIPDASCKVLVFDDQNRGVVGATVTIVGSSTRAITGRNGRGDFLATPRGRVVLDVDGTAAAASDGDELAHLRVATTIVGPDVDVPIHLPELSAGTAATVPVGMQVSNTVVSSAGGATLTIANGLSVGMPDSSSSVTVRLGELSAAHLPGDLPFAGSNPNLFGRGVYIDPPGVRFLPGADLSVPDDLQLGTATPQLYHLDPETGEWGAVAIGSPGNPTTLGTILEGGLYAWAVGSPGATVSGRVVDASATPATVARAIVRVDGRATTTANDGSFAVEYVPTRVGDGTPRNTSLEVFANGSWLPAIASAAVTYDPPSTGFLPVGDVVLDTLPAGNIRVQQVVRARADAFQPCRLSSVLGDVALFTTGDANGQAFFEDVPFGYFGYQEGRRRDAFEVFYGQQVSYLVPGRRWLDNYQFLLGRAWFQGTRSVRAYICDSVGGGPLLGAVLVEGEIADQGFLVETTENGYAFAERGFRRRGTALNRSERDGQLIRHAYSVEFSSSDHFEFPLRRVLRQPLGAFERHGLVAGNLTGVTGGREHGLRVTRRITRQEWWDAIVEGLPLQTSLPIDVDPATTHAAFAAGLPAAGGNLAAIEYTTPAAKNRLEAMGLLVGFAPTEGATTAVDVPLEHVASDAFTIVGAATGAPAEVDVNALDVALALESAEGHLVDVARDLNGSLAVSGADLTLTLPPLSGALANSRWLALLRGSTSSGGVTSSHASLVSLSTAATNGFAYPEFPTLTAPAPGATVSAANGFEVQFTLPTGAIAGMLELRSETTGELLLWQAVTRPDEPNFTFVPLPTEADEETPLIAGRTYDLKITAWFGDVDIVSPNSYGEFVAFAQSIGIVEGGVTQVTSRSIQITTN